MVGDILQPTHLLFILVVALLVLGPKRLPEVGRQLGNGLRDFRAALNGERSERAETTSRASVSLDPTPLGDEPAAPPQPAVTQPMEPGYAAPVAQPIDPGYALAGQAAAAPNPGAAPAEQSTGRGAAPPPAQLG